MNQPRLRIALLSIAAASASLGCAATPLDAALPDDSLGAYDQQACAENALRRSANAALVPGAAEIMLRGCVRGQAGACSIAGVMYELGRGVPRDHAQAMSLYERACNRGNARGCGNLGELRLHARGREDALPLLERACSAGQGRACVALGRAELESVVPNASVMARARFERACGAGEAAGCVALADMLERRAAPGDPARAVELLERACARGDEEGCSRYAQRAHGH